MNRLNRPLFGVAVAVLAITLMGASNVPGLSMSKNAAMILNPGNGDYSGFRIAVEPNGRATAIDAAGRAANELSSDLVNQFFADLSSAAPVAAEPATPCSVTSSLATTTVEVNAAISITWKDRRWSNLSCTADARATKLASDATAIEHALYVQSYRERTIAFYVGNNAGYSALSAQPANVYAGQSFSNFNAGRFDAGRLSLGSYGGNPYSGMPSGGLPSSSLPYASIGSGLPSGSLPSSSPYTSLQTTGLPSSSPYGSSPFGSSP